MARRSLCTRIVFCEILISWDTQALTAGDPSPAGETLKLIFIHHACGENWLADDSGGLGLALWDNGYFVRDTNYGWGPSCENCEDYWDAIGDCTNVLQ